MKSPVLLFLGFLMAFSSFTYADDSLPVFHKDDVILFQGDSITDGGRAISGDVLNHGMGQNYAYIISARISAKYPELNLKFINRGVSGNQVPDLAARWQRDTLDLKPNILSILIGINDCFHGSVTQYEQVYDKLLADTQAALPGVKIILAEPFLLNVGGSKPGYPVNIVKLKDFQDVVVRLGAKYKLPVIDYPKAFEAACQKAPAEYWSIDGVHPTPAGHGLMVEEWLAAVKKAWPN